LLLCSLLPLFGSVSVADDTGRIAAKKVLSGLNQPTSIAIRPESGTDTYEVFLAEAGAGRITKFRSDKPEKRADVVAGFSTKLAGGLQSLYFLDHLRLVVAGGDEDGAPFVRLYELPDSESPLTVDQHKDEAKLPESAAEPRLDAHVFRQFVRTRANDRVGDYLIAAAAGQGESADLAYVPVRSGALGDVVPASLKNASENFQVDALAAAENGYVTVAVRLAGVAGGPSRLAFFNPLDRHVVMQMPTGLGHITALAYSPKSGNLYAANAPANRDGKGGIYRIDRADSGNTPACKVVKIADVRDATALVFAADNTLYVATSGSAKDSSGGSLVRLTGDL
jgi:hypothetical protein